MKNAKFILALLLIAATLLCACGEDPAPAPADTTVHSTTAPVTTISDDTEPADSEEPEEAPFEDTAMLINDGQPCVVIIAEGDALPAAQSVQAILKRYGASVEIYAPAAADIPELARLTFLLDASAPAGTFTLCPNETGLLLRAPTADLLQVSADLLIAATDRHATGGMTGYSVTIPSEELQYSDSVETR